MHAGTQREVELKINLIRAVLTTGDMQGASEQGPATHPHTLPCRCPLSPIPCPVWLAQRPVKTE